jgi:hypothetical protein
MRRIDDDYRARSPLICQAPQQSTQHPRTAPIGEHMPGLMEMVGGEAEIAAGAQAQHRIHPSVEHHGASMQFRHLVGGRTGARMLGRLLWGLAYQRGHVHLQFCLACIPGDHGRHRAATDYFRAVEQWSRAQR